MAVSGSGDSRSHGLFSCTSSGTQIILPWGVRKERPPFPFNVVIDTEVKPGEYVLRTLFAEFTVQAERKIDTVLSEPLERPLSKSLQRGEDPIFDQLLSAFGSVAEHCLPSLLHTLYAWYDHQLQGFEYNQSTDQRQRTDSKSTKSESVERTDLDYLHERRDLAVEFIFCLVLIEVLKQFAVHPGHEDLVNHIENLAFKHFKFREGAQTGPNAQNVNIIADLYAEVIGVLAQSRFQSVRKCFMAELKELKGKEPSPITTHSVISLLMGMKFFRVKMVPIEEFEASFQFMQECATYFLEVKDKDIKHALAGLFVEILVPVAASVKNEVNVPCLKNFVEMLYSQTLDLSTKKKHSLALFPLVTCLLCVSQKLFFLQNWHYFLAMCLSHLKNRDPKMCRVALESLYRLLWVYMIRIKCESNTATQSRLQSIVNSLFPKGSKAVVPRDTPLNIFVKIIQFIAQERLDFAMKEIVFDLISVGRPIKIILTPERMNIGLRSFLVVADSLQQKEGDPPMPRTVGVLPSGNTLRVKKTFLNKMLTEETAKTIGMSQYYPYVRKAFDDILRALDVQFGRPLMMTTVQNINKEPDDMITGERKPKIDLFRTCVAAVPRLIPDGMSRQDLVDLLSRLTVHMDEELRGLAFQSLQNMISDFPDWREDVIHGFVQFILREVNDTFPQLLDNSLRMLLQLLTNWKNTFQSHITSKKETQELAKSENLKNVLHHVEAVALVMLCNCRLTPRRLAAHILKEVKFLFKSVVSLKENEEVLIDSIDRVCPTIIEKCLVYLPTVEKAAVMSASNIDLQWLAERTSSAWTSGLPDTGEGSNKVSNVSLYLQETSGFDAWSILLIGLLDRDHIPKMCPMAISHSWNVVFSRISSLFAQLDVNPVNDNRASLLRTTTATKKALNEREIHLCLWRNYLVFACRVAPASLGSSNRYISPEVSINSSPENVNIERSETRFLTSGSASLLFKQIIPLLRSEQADIRGAVVLGLAFVNHLTIKELMEELVVFIREAIDRKQENMRRRRRRDVLRVHLARVLELIAEQGTFGISSSVLDRDCGSLNTTFVEYIDGARMYLESENDKDVPAIVQEIKQHFCSFIHKLIKSFPLESRQNLLGRELRGNLFNLFASWSGKFGSSFGFPDRKPVKNDLSSDFEFSALQGMSAVLCCGSTYDPLGLSEESPVYVWLNSLLESSEDRIYQLAQETVILLLELNPDVGYLLDWLVDCCYKGSIQVADGSFNALATIFSVREYPCDHYMAIINVTLMNTGCPRTSIQEAALQLLQILDHRFFRSLSTLSIDEEDNIVSETGVQLRKKTHHNFESLISFGYTCSQMDLSRHMAHIHPELTMPMFSEITYRFQTARPSVRQNLLQYLLPWLYNMELVDPNIPQPHPLGNIGRIPEFCTSDSCTNNVPLEKREGWGSAEATEMVLNNLFYITAKFGDEHSKEVEDLWAALCSCWPNNLKVIIRYLFIVTGLAPLELLLYAKRVIVYLARSRPERLLDEMMSELQTVETLNCLIERTETPPFFRVTNIRKGSSHSDDGGSNSTHAGENCARGLELEKGTIHTKRRSAEDGSEKDTIAREDCSGHSSLHSTSSVCSLSKSERALTNSLSLPKEDGEIYPVPLLPASVEEDSFMLMCRVGREEEQPHKPDTPQPHPLPMPEYGGFYAPLTEFLPNSSQPVTAFHRCNLALLLTADVVLDRIAIDWSPHIPLMLHIIFLGLDHSRPLVHEHCKRLLLNLLIVLAHHNDHLSVAKILLSNKTKQLGLGLPMVPVHTSSLNFSECFKKTKDSHLSPNGDASVSIGSLSTINRGSSLYSATGSLQTIVKMDSDNSLLKGLVKTLIDYLTMKKNHPLWNAEDITAKVWSIRSAEQMAEFLQQVLFVFKESFPLAHIEERWAQMALQLALSCSSRHYAGRSLQIFRALKVPLSPRMLLDILSRLVETVSEQGEDMQGYVTELMLTLEASVDLVDSNFRITEFMKEFFKSTPNLNKDMNRRSGPPTSGSPASQSSSNTPSPRSGHVRSTSYSVSYLGRKVTDSPSIDSKDGRSRLYSDTDAKSRGNNLGRSRSAQSLKTDEHYCQEDRAALLPQFFWIAVSLLESDYEHEFLLALRLLEKVLSKLALERTDSQEKLERILPQMKWSSFPGVHALLLKGCTSPGTYEPTVSILSQLTPLLDIPIIDPSESLSFPFNIMALFPFLLANYDDPTSLCIRTADSIAQACMDRSSKLENLATVMTLYSRRSFSKESFHWAKCVIKYLYDAYSHVFFSLISFLVEILEKGPPALMQHVMNILYCMLHYLDVTTSAQIVNSDLLRVVSRYVESPQWKDALKIMKLIVTRSSTLAAPPATMGGGGSVSLSDSVSISSSISFADSDFGSKRELPGRTMEFAFDVTTTPIVGQRFQIRGTTKDETPTELQQPQLQQKEENAAGSPRRSLSHNHSFTENGSVSGWKRPWLSQARTREHLISLLTSCGQRVGLPKSPSVIFSQSSDILEHQSSMCSSTEEVSAINNDMSGDSKLEDTGRTEQQFGLFKDFDFLEYELEGQEADGMDSFNWGVRRKSITNFEGGSVGGSSSSGVRLHSGTTTSNVTLSPRKEESSDDEMGSVSPLDEVHSHQLPVGVTSSLVFPPSSLPLSEHSRRPSSPMSGSSHSLVSDGDLTLSNASPSFSPLVSSLPSQPPPEDVEETWRCHVHGLMAADKATGILAAASSYTILARLLRETFQRMARTTRECCQLFSNTDAFRKIAALFLTMVDVLLNQAECPYIQVDPDLLTSLLERHKFCILELQEHWETFSDKRVHVLELLSSIKSMLKLEALGEPVGEDSIEDQRIELCRCLYKLHFQLMLLLDSYSKLLSLLASLAEHRPVVDLSQEVTSLQRELVRAVEDTESDRLSPAPQAEVTSLSYPEAESTLLELIQERRWGKLFKHLHSYRTMFPGMLLGSGEEDDIDIILALFCRYLCEGRCNHFVMSRPEHSTGAVCHQLMDISLQLSSAIHQLEHAGPTTPADNTEKPRPQSNPT